LEAAGGDAGAARNALVDDATAYLFRRNEDTEFLEVFLRNGGTERLYWKDLVSGALIMSVVERAKDFAIKRSIEKASELEGVSSEDLHRAIRVEYKENEIFPKTDTQEDWLKLLDYEPENVVNLKPIRSSKSTGGSRRTII
jgi:proteasome-associated ATPase